jgi:hypothetical protein
MIGGDSPTCGCCSGISGCSRARSCYSWANAELDWRLLEAGPYHRGLHQFVKDLNKLYLAEPALWKSDYDLDGFHWIDASDHLNSVLSFLRQDPEHFNELVVIANLTPVPRLQYRIGLPRPGKWCELLNSDAAAYGGSNMGNQGSVTAAAKPWHNQPCSADFILPPLSILAFRPERVADKGVASPQAEAEEKPEMTKGADQVLSATGGSTPVPPHPDPLPGGEGTAKAGTLQAESARAGVRSSSGAAIPDAPDTSDGCDSSTPRDVGAREDAVPRKDPGSHSISRLKDGNNTAQGNALGMSPPHQPEP